jgi:hypothetical protein
VSQGKNVTVDVSSGSKCHSGRNVGGRNVKASRTLPVYSPDETLTALPLARPILYICIYVVHMYEYVSIADRVTLLGFLKLTFRCGKSELEHCKGLREASDGRMKVRFSNL